MRDTSEDSELYRTNLIVGALVYDILSFKFEDSFYQKQERFRMSFSHLFFTYISGRA